MSDLSAWSSDDFAERPDVLVAMLEVVELVGAAKVSRSPDREVLLHRAMAKSDAVYVAARRGLTPDGDLATTEEDEDDA